MSLRGRVVLAVTAAVAVAIALASVASFLIVRAELIGQVDTALRDRLAGRHFTIVQISPTQVAPFPDLPPAAFGGAEGYVQVVSERGRVFRPEGEQIALPVSADTRAVAAGAEPPFFSTERVAGVRVRIYTVSAGNGFAVQIARPLSEADAALSRLGGILLIVTLAGAALAAAAGLLIARAGLRPVRRLTDAVENVAATRDLSRRIEETGNDEVGRLAVRFNAMLDALQAAEAAQRQLVADASHELRTPLTSIRTNIEVLARGDQLSREERERILTDLVAELEELSVLVGDLVDLAREGGGGDRAAEEAMEDVRLDDLVAAAVERARRHAPSIAFQTDLEACVVRGLPARLDRAVANLLDNAVKWSPPGGPIEVSVRDGVVSVRDHGPGIADEDLPFVFDRFYRAAASRGLPGSGLGLAIVRQVADRHGGTAEAAPAEGGGARLSLRLPVAVAALPIPPRP